MVSCAGAKGEFAMRRTVGLNYGWKFKRADAEVYRSIGFDDSSWESVDIPHCSVPLPLSHFDETLCETVCWYRIQIPSQAFSAAQRAFLRFEGVSSSAEVFVDGQLAMAHQGGFTPFLVSLPNITTQDNLTVAVRVDSHEQPDIPPFGGQLDYLAYGGIYREVYLETTGEAYLEDIFVKPEPASTGSALVAVEVSIGGTLACDAALLLAVTDGEGRIVATWTAQAVAGTVSTSAPVAQARLWEPDNPVLYTVQADLRCAGRTVDSATVRFGFRTIRFTERGVSINGNYQQLRGLNRHQSYPYVGFAMPASMQRSDADVLKFDLGVDIVRTSHYPQHRAFLDRCDEIGLLVFTEMPGWQHVGSSQTWRSLALRDVRQMVKRDRNHPSVVLWGVRINESADDDDLYSRTNEAARWLDPSRQTAGVRNFKRSRLLEDVYTYNDFIHRGTNRALDDPDVVSGDRHAPFMVTEHTGHMYPARRDDPEPVCLEHALRHARVLDALYADKRRCGAIGWCMSDYNTHRYFGSGDRICHHGVTDIFRIPKLAAAVYASQSDRKPVMEVSNSMDIGAHAAHDLGPVYVFTNCDRVELSYNGRPVGSYTPDKVHFPHLPHPPVLVDDLIGNRLDELEGFSQRDRAVLHRLLLAASKRGFDLSLAQKLSMALLLKRKGLGISDAVKLFVRFVGMEDSPERTWTFKGMRGDTVVIEKVLTNGGPLRMEAVADRNVLKTGGDTYDVVRIVVRVVSAWGIIARLYNGPVTVATHGPIQSLGPETVALSAGATALYVRTVGRVGDAQVEVVSPQFGCTSVQVRVE